MVAALTNFPFEFFKAAFTQDSSLSFLYHDAKESKIDKKLNENEGGGGYCRLAVPLHLTFWPFLTLSKWHVLEDALRNTFFETRYHCTFSDD